MQVSGENLKYAAIPIAINYQANPGFRLEPDTLAFAQYFENLRRKTVLEPEKLLMLAVLEDAIHCFRENVLAQGRKKGKLFREIEEWIRKASLDWTFSFESICESLGFNAEYLREGLLRWKEKQLPKTSHDGRGRSLILAPSTEFRRRFSRDQRGKPRAKLRSMTRGLPGSGRNRKRG